MLFSNHTLSMARSTPRSVAASVAAGTVLVTGTLVTIVPGAIVGTCGVGICRLIRRITGNPHRCHDAELQLGIIRYGVLGVIASNSVSIP